MGSRYAGEYQTGTSRRVSRLRSWWRTRGGTALFDQLRAGGGLPGALTPALSSVGGDGGRDRDRDLDRTSTHPTSVSNAIQATANQAARMRRLSAPVQRAYCSSKVVATFVNRGVARMV